MSFCNRSEQVNHGVISNKRFKKGCCTLPRETWFRANLSCWLWHPSIDTLVLITLCELSYLRQQWAGCPARWQSGTGLAHSSWHSPDAKRGHSQQTTDPQGSARNGFAGCTCWSRSHSSAKPVSRQVWDWGSDEEQSAVPAYTARSDPLWFDIMTASTCYKNIQFGAFTINLFFAACSVL